MVNFVQCHRQDEGEDKTLDFGAEGCNAYSGRRRCILYLIFVPEFAGSILLLLPTYYDMIPHLLIIPSAGKHKQIWFKSRVGIFDEKKALHLPA